MLCVNNTGFTELPTVHVIQFLSRSPPRPEDEVEEQRHAVRSLRDSHRSDPSCANCVTASQLEGTARSSKAAAQTGGGDGGLLLACRCRRRDAMVRNRGHGRIARPRQLFWQIRRTVTLLRFYLKAIPRTCQNELLFWQIRRCK